MPQAEPPSSLLNPRALIMAQSIVALANHKLLRWARKSAGMEAGVAAKRAGIALERLRSWEDGTSHPTIAQLRGLATIYRRPLAVFYLPEPPRDFAPLRDLRRLPDTAGGFSTALRFLVRRVREQEAWLVETLQEGGAAPLPFVGSVKASDDMVAVAASTRKLLALSPAGQRSWRLRDWTDALEAVGVFVLQSGEVPVDEMRGFVLTNRFAPMVVLNSRDARVARVFTLFHEFAHLLLGVESISNYAPTPGARTHTSSEETEVICNLLAAEILVPESDLRRRLELVDHDEDLDVLILSLARAYAVSREVVARRLVHVGRISRRTYGQKRRLYRAESQEAEDEDTETPKQVRIPMATRVVSANGRALTRLVLSAYGEGTLTGPDVSGLLRTKLKHLPAIEAMVFAG
jgi:Zn-dependent peptidase ImmA (M78 family)/transcriptional regulator with XRE-family HTH domain